ncbi:MAG: response regulator [Gammaproteobacteria bacterium]|nr:response regulator [Gammaproteobacteria bacterium]
MNNTSFVDLQRKAKYFADILNLVPSHLFWKDKESVFLGCNLLFSQSAGLKSPEDIIGRTDYDLPWTKEESDKYRADDKAVMLSGQARINTEEVQTLADGTKTVLLTSKVPLHADDGTIVGVIGMYQDITHLKKAQEQAETANKLKTEFIQNMQHDIRTPISGLFSLLDATNRDGNLEEFKDYLPYATKATKELLDICNEVIDFENVEYGKKPIYSRKFSLLDTLHGAINLNGAAALVHKSTLELNVNDKVPDVVKGDDYRLKKILINLIGNAVKFTENGKITLCVKVVNQQEKQATIRFKVSDTGIGISEDKIHTIFEKFTRLNPSNAGKFKGTGLGLYIVKKYTEEIDAELDVKSTLGKGTVFTIDVRFDLPMVNQLADEEEHVELSRHILVDVNASENDAQKVITPIPKATPKPKAQPSNTSGQDTIHICLVEDDILAMRGAVDILSRLARPCELTKSVNVAEALHALKQQAFDLVICDLGLPDGTGFDIVSTIKQSAKHPNHKTPFVALTAHSDDAKRNRAKEAGFLAVYNKPLHKEHADKILADYVPDKNISEQVKIVDLALSAEIFGGNESSVIDMLTMLIESFSLEKQLFEEAFNTNNFTRARELFHKFRGGLSYIRVPEVDKLAMMLHEDVKEFEKRNEPLEKLNDKLLALFKAVDEVEAWLTDYRKQHS